MNYYVLHGHSPVMALDLRTWAEWFETADRRVAWHELGPASVSTVFLGLDHQFGDSGPMLFETMIFGGPHNGHCERYSTWDEAEAGHLRALALAQETLGAYMCNCAASGHEDKPKQHGADPHAKNCAIYQSKR